MSYNKAYYESHRAYHNEYTRRWRAKNPTKQREYTRRYRERYPDRAAASAKRWRVSHPAAVREQHRRARGKDKMRDVKRVSLALAFIDAAKASGCVDCGNRNLAVLDLDHVRGEKVRSVSEMVRVTPSRLFAEIEKCEPRCANCHRIATAARRRAA